MSAVLEGTPPLAERANDGLHAHVTRVVTELCPDRAAPIVDLGCGTGALLQRLRALGYRDLAGIDIAPPAWPGVRWIEADLDACRAPLADASIALVTAVEVFEHVENPGALLDEVARWLAPTGRLLLTTPNVHSLEARLRWLLLGRLKQFDALGDPTHLTPLFEFPFRRLLARRGLEIEREWGFPLDGASPTSRGALRAAARVARALGLRGRPAGDQWCVIVRRSATAATADKRDAVTRHYGARRGEGLPSAFS